MMRGAIRALIPAFLTAAALAGCSSSADGGTDEGKNGDTAPPEAAESTGAEEGGTVGGAGSPCELPVTFALAADWKPQAVTVEPDSGLAELTEQGTVTLVCEIDAKPAGSIGYIRVWRGGAPGEDPAEALKAFVTDEPGAGEAVWTRVKAGALAATEVAYTVDGELLDEPKKERAFAVATPGGPVVVHLGGLDSDEHEAMLPAYELAKRTLKVG
ncbi:lipoprotein [Streptomyces sp. NPDC059166]|uniref:lipoprotein n=1 Tax=Streptomyces sp. NPDC059166 TaxID=3346752 RepID=UPI0036879BD1